MLVDSEGMVSTRMGVYAPNDVMDSCAECLCPLPSVQVLPFDEVQRRRGRTNWYRVSTLYGRFKEQELTLTRSQLG